MVRKKLLLGLDVREVSLDDDGDELFERNAPRLGDAHELRPLFGFEVEFDDGRFRRHFGFGNHASSTCPIVPQIRNLSRFNAENDLRGGGNAGIVGGR